MEFCCEMMRASVYCTNENTVFSGELSDKVVYYDSSLDEYGLPIHDGPNTAASSIIAIKHCPWCAKKLPDSKRDEWCDRLEQLGYEPFSDDIPEIYKTSEWYKE